jgi:hypothetical protein
MYDNINCGGGKGDSEVYDNNNCGAATVSLFFDQVDKPDNPELCKGPLVKTVQLSRLYCYYCQCNHDHQDKADTHGCIKYQTLSLLYL